MDDILRMNDIVSYLKVSKATIYRWVKDGSFPKGEQLGANTRIWTRESIEKWLDAKYTEKHD